MYRYYIMLICIVVVAIKKIVFYIIDAKREEQGLPSLHREYTEDLTGGMDFVNHYRSEIEQQQAAAETIENERRSQYVFHNDGQGMTDISTISSQPNDSIEGADITDETDSL